MNSQEGIGAKSDFRSMSITDLTKWVWSCWCGLGSAYQLGLGVLLIVALALVALAAYGIILWPRGVTEIENLTEFQQQQLAGDRRLFAIQLAGALIVFIGLYLTFRRIKASERQVDAMEQATDERHDAAMAQLQATEEGQVTERFSRAVEQLGSGNLATRVGGIYALERLARDSRGDHPTVVETLCAFIREESSCEVSYPLETNQTKTKRPRTDVQSACDVICRLSKLSGVEQPVINFEGVKLADINLDSGDFSRANFEAAHLNYARFTNCTLDGARIVVADMQGARIAGGSADETVFNAAKLNGTVFRDVIPANCRFLGDQFEDVSFYNCDLRNAEFFDAVLKQIHEIDVDCKLDPATEERFRSSNYNAIRERWFGNPLGIEDSPKQD